MNHIMMATLAQKGMLVSWRLILWLEEGKAIISLHRDRRASSF